eukprot:TRINITY_DN33090_c0_g1_i1.p1 TRINITY_DN33090_c0_g1~~TRINITY_DN33090_c0_g1_i1.p1  ORF type:complete len:236 (+),score=8.43 TRINITY_DN33090_c0_g1_i1:67-708(+)
MAVQAPSASAATSNAAVVAAPRTQFPFSSSSSSSLSIWRRRPTTSSIKLMASSDKAQTPTTQKPEPAAPEGFTPPQLDPNTPSPIFGGSTGGLLRKAQVEEFYVITWESPKEQMFEMPTGGLAIMREGPNLLKLARKEQCLALGTRLRSKFKIKYQFYRVFPNGEVQYLHPKDGVYPEKANAGREGVGLNMRSIGKNVNPIEVKFTGKEPFDL